jgi:hypothetical protein
MPLISGLYDSAPIQPVVKIKENISIYTRAKWQHYSVEYIEPMPRSSPFTADLVAAGTVLAAAGQINKQLLAILQLDDGEFLQVRWEPIDDVEAVLWETAPTGRFVTRGVHCRVDIGTRLRDPYLSTTQFFVIGRDRDAQIQIFNPLAVAQPTARLKFWGFRYVIEPLSSAICADIVAGRKNTTYLPAEGTAGLNPNAGNPR